MYTSLATCDSSLENTEILCKKSNSTKQIKVRKIIKDVKNNKHKWVMTGYRIKDNLFDYNLVHLVEPENYLIQLPQKIVLTEK